MSEDGLLKRWLWKIYHSSHTVVDSTVTFVYWWRLSSAKPPSVYREIALQATNTLDLIYPEGISYDAHLEVQGLLQVCTILGGGMNYLGKKLHIYTSQWEHRQRRIRWKQYLLDINPVQWVVYLTRKHIFHEKVINPVAYPALVIDQNNELFDLACYQLGKSFYVLEELISFLKQKPTEQELELFIKEKYIQFLTSFVPKIGSMSPEELSKFIKNFVNSSEERLEEKTSGKQELYYLFKEIIHFLIIFI